MEQRDQSNKVAIAALNFLYLALINSTELPLTTHTYYVVHAAAQTSCIFVFITLHLVACIFVAKDGYWKGPQVFDSDPAVSQVNRVELFASYLRTTKAVPTRIFQKSDWGALHSFLGLFACCIAWAQPINSLFRGHPTSRYRFIFNGVHRSLGILAFLLACKSEVREDSCD